jgi:membrane-associated phospholipid phosphatase
MSNDRSIFISPRQQVRHGLAGFLALIAVLGFASTAAAITMPLHLADTAPGSFVHGTGLPRAEPEALRLGADPGDLGTPDLRPEDAPGAAAPPATYGAPSRPVIPSLAAFPGQVGRDFLHLVVRPLDFDAQDWTRFALGAGAVGVAAAFDNRIRTAVQARRTSGATSLATRVRPIGIWGGVAAMGVALAAGELFHDPELAATGLDGIEASLFSAAIIAPALKKITGRERPNAGEGPSDFGFFSTDQSFPSGEVTMAFTNAAVISQHTDSVALRIIAWGLAGLVGWERIQLDAHWTSDVVAGALIGSAVGSWVAAIHKPDETRSHTTVSVLPLVGRRTLGVTASISW